MMKKDNRTIQRLLKQFLAFVLILSLVLPQLPVSVTAAETVSGSVYAYYVDGTGSGSEDGSSPENAFQYLSDAYAAFSGLLNDADIAYIVLTGPVSLIDDPGVGHPGNRAGEYGFAAHQGQAVLTSVYNGADYTSTGSIAFSSKILHLFGNTRFEGLVIASSLDTLLAGYHAVHFGEGIVSSASGQIAVKNIYGGTNSAVGTASVLKDTSITIDSGKYTNVFGGGSSYQGSVARAKNYSTQIRINGGTIGTVYGTGSGNTDNAHQKSVFILMNGGTVTDIYGAHKEGTVYETVGIAVYGGTVTGKVYGADKYIRPESGTNTAYTPTIHGNIGILISEEALVSSVVGAVTDANVLGRRRVEFKNCGSEQAYAVPHFLMSNVDSLYLAGAFVHLSSSYGSAWEGLTELQIADDSRLQLGFIPDSHSVELRVTKTQEDYAFDTVFITAPYGTGNIFTLRSPIVYELWYTDGDVEEEASWFLSESELTIGQAGEDGVPLNVELGLPESYDGVIDGSTTYDRFLQRLDELGDASKSAKVISSAAIQGEIQLFVSPDGSDTNSGSITAPLRTVQKALSYVEAIKSSLPVKGFVIYLREGIYLTTDTITLGAQHSGTDEAPLIISAYNSEEVKLRGGVSIPGSSFTPVTDEAEPGRIQSLAESHVVVADLSGLGISDYGSIVGGGTGGPTYQVYSDGEPLTLARYPNVTKLSLGQVLDIGPVTANYSTFPQGTNASSTGIEFVMQDLRPLNWLNTGSIWLKGALYAEWDTRNMRVAQVREATSSVKLDGGNTLGAISGVSHTYYYYNILEELDVPGEYYLDIDRELLFMYPIDPMNDAEIILSVSQKDILSINGASNVVVNGLTLEYGSGSGAVMSNCRKVLIQNCTIQNFSNTGVVIDGKKSGVIYSTVRNIGNYPVRILGSNSYFNYTPDNNYLQNSYIHNVGSLNPKYSYITLNGVGNVISHNLVQGTFSVGIYNQTGRECIVEYNEIVGGPNGTYDCAAIYTIGFPISRGNHYRYNYIHDIFVETEGSNPHGIYFDEMCSENYAYGNVMDNIPSGFFTNSGGENIVVNNVISSGRLNSTASVYGQSNFNNFTLPQWLARSSLLNSTMNSYKNLSSTQKEALRSRFPTLCAYYEDALSVLAQREALGAGYTVTATEQALVTAHDNYFAGNISYNHKGVVANGSNHITGPNLITSQDPFINAENHDYRLKEEANPGFNYTPVPFEQMGVWGEKQGLGAFEGYAPVDASTGEVYSNEVLLKWDISAGADYYRVTVSENQSFTGNVKTYRTENPYYFALNYDFFDYGKTYYWSIEAFTTAKSRTGGSRLSQTSYSFTTMTVEEYLKKNAADKAKLRAVVDKAQALHLSMTEGTGEGEYAPGSMQALADAISDAEEVLEASGKLQDEVDGAAAALKQAIIAAVAAQNILYAGFDSLSEEDWVEAGAARATVTEGENSLLMSVLGNRTELVYKNPIGPRQILTFDFTLDTLKDWHGFALRQSNKDVFVTTAASTNSYFICIKEDQFELQKRKDGNSYGNSAVLANNHSIMTSGVTYRMELGAITQADGSVRILFKVDGQTVFDYTDSSNSIIEPGYFGIILQQANGIAEISGVSF